MRIFPLIYLTLLAVLSAQCGSSAFSEFLADSPALEHFERKKRRILVDNSGILQNLTDFPVMVRLNAARIDYANVQNAGQDLRFYAADGVTQLAHEIETWNNAAGESYVWVKLPQIAASPAINFFWMEYGDKAADGQNAANVWDADFKGVWHMNTAGKDSTVNGFHWTNNGATATSGKVGDALSFNTGYLELQNTLLASSRSAITFSAWIKRVGTTNTPIISCSIENIATISRFSFSSTTTSSTLVSIFNLSVSTDDSDASGPPSINGVLSPDLWYLVSVETGFAIGSLYIYLNGIPILQSPTFGWDETATASATSAIARIGGDLSGASFLGAIDEARFSSAVRSAAWHFADYKSMTDTLLIFVP